MNYKHLFLYPFVALGSFVLGYVVNPNVATLAELEASNLTLTQQLEDAQKQAGLKEEQRKALNDKLWETTQKLEDCESSKDKLQSDLNTTQSNLNTTQQELSFCSQTKIQRPVVVQNTRGYVPGTCADLRELGLSHFSTGDPNYSQARDRDGDGIACE